MSSATFCRLKVCPRTSSEFARSPSVSKNTNLNMMLRLSGINCAVSSVLTFDDFKRDEDYRREVQKLKLTEEQGDRGSLTGKIENDSLSIPATQLAGVVAGIPASDGKRLRDLYQVMEAGRDTVDQSPILRRLSRFGWLTLFKLFNE